MTDALKLTELSKSFPVGKPLFGKPKAIVRAVRPVSLRVATGETLGIVGESGCGKSTLARMLVGLLPPSTGTIEIEGEAQDTTDPAAFGRRIQYVFQDPISSLNPRKTIRQIIEAPLKLLHDMGRAERDARLREILAAVNLREDFLTRYPHEFSGGQAQRIGIARALAANARILILDEPVSALDVSVQAQVLNLLADLKAELGLTYLFISRDRQGRGYLPPAAPSLHPAACRQRAGGRPPAAPARGPRDRAARPAEPAAGLLFRGALSIRDGSLQNDRTAPDPDGRDPACRLPPPDHPMSPRPARAAPRWWPRRSRPGSWSKG
jgi:ABC-type dipeptide/oligopeptide/nickel transport system ATPase subunit